MLSLLLCSMALLAAEPSSPRLEGARALTSEPGYLDPTFTPAGDAISLAGPSYKGVFLLPLGEPSDPAPILPDVDAWRHGWTPDGRRITIPHRVEKPGRSFCRVTGASEEISSPAVTTSRGDVIYLGDGPPRRLTKGEDRFFEPALSPDGQWVSFVGLSTGVHALHLGDGRLVHGGPGTHPAWTPDGRWLLFERVDDDGKEATGADLFALRPETGAVVRLTESPESMNRHPAVSPDGGFVVFLRDDVPWLARWEDAE